MNSYSDDLQKRLLKKLEDKEKAAQSANKADPLKPPKPLEINTKLDITGKGQSLEDYMKAMGIPVKKKTNE
jgi:hypothetical protein